LCLNYSLIPLKLGLSTHAGYQTPLNAAAIFQGSPYLYFGFLPDNISGIVTTWGLTVSNNLLSYAKAITVLPNYIALFPGFSEFSSINVGTATYTMCQRLFSTAYYVIQNPSARVMPDDYFMFVEAYWPGSTTTGCQTNSNSANMNALNIRSVAIGFK